jgi:hypothetical protein
MNMAIQPLYKLADEYVAIAMQLADSDLPDDVIADTLEGASGDIENKAWNTAALILQFSGEAAIIKEAEQRMSARRKSLERRVEWMRDYVLVQLIRTGIGEIDSPEFVIRVQDNPPKVILDDEEAVPNAFKMTETVTTIRKAEIRKLLLDGQSVAGAHLESEKRLSIK